MTKLFGGASKQVQVPSLPTLLIYALPFSRTATVSERLWPEGE
ncbi:hypothetical protein QUB48_18145 [Microcoleus sp. ARI1-A5]